MTDTEMIVTIAGAACAGNLVAWKAAPAHWLKRKLGLKDPAFYCSACASFWFGAAVGLAFWLDGHQGYALAAPPLASCGASLLENMMMRNG